VLDQLAKELHFPEEFRVYVDAVLAAPAKPTQHRGEGARDGRFIDPTSVAAGTRDTAK
jgi:hypothetical protein